MIIYLMKNFNEIKEILDIKSKKKINDKEFLEDFNWDSLAMINLISLANKKYKKKINGEKLNKLSTIKDLDNLISKLKMKK